MRKPRPVLESLIIGLSDDTTYITVGARVAERHTLLCVKSGSSEMVSGPKVINVRHPTDDTFENMT